MNFIVKPSRENIKTYVPIGLLLVSLSLIDVFFNAFFDFNLIGFLVVTLILISGSRGSELIVLGSIPL